ncbi:small-conductance mechanosensitive channel [Constrictibacter sp. MBR-5]|jgi:small-conductance mechanosensitive channel|uniref:mechanosensitive ion channel family protein n=1 Tax=Constrictibacter sp. MBR-5 TaxID=3156467 RepID=UPI003394E851
MDRLTDYLSSLQASLPWVPDRAISLAVIAVAVVLAWWLHRILFAAVLRLVSTDNLFRRSLVTRTRRPSRLAFLMVATMLAASVAPLSPEGAGIVRHLMLLGLILLIGWMARTALHIWLVVHLRRFKLDSADNLLARKHVTQTRILQRIAEILIIIVTIAAALMTFDGIRQYGISLLASAGAASLVVGLALQPVLKNLFAGIQLAITQPIRIDDALLVENEWGNVEEITATYVVVRIWDWRRLIVPLSYFIEKPFQNWTREGSALIGSVFLYVDFTVPVAELRAELERVVQSSDLWDGRVVALQVTDFRENTMEIRMLASASNAGRTFDLRCEVRERMVAFVQQRYPHALPRLRADVIPGGATAHVDGPAPGPSTQAG